MPDALSKTIPIWCAVLNYIAFGNVLFFTPPNVVSASEHDQIKVNIASWAKLAVENGFDVDNLKEKVRKPLRPIWITPDAYLPDEVPKFSEFYPLVLCTASRMVQDGAENRQGYIYVQGAADDHEEWARSLTPQLLWSNREKLGNLQYSDSQLYEMIEGIARNKEIKVDLENSGISRIMPTNISIGCGIDLSKSDISLLIPKFELIIDVSEKPMISNVDSNSMKYISYPLLPGKKGSKELRSFFPQLISRLEKESLFKSNILIICDSGTDFSIGIALVIICLFYSSSEIPLESRTTTFLDKTEIRKRLVHIITQRKCNPSRSTLNSVNSYLMS